MDIHDIDLTISDLYDCGAWQLQTLYTHLPQHVVDHITGLLFNLNPGVDDALIWCNMEGVYTA